MRCEASELCVGSCDSAAIGGATFELPADPTSASAATAAIALLAKRSTRGFVEETKPAGVDSDRGVVSEPKLDVGRERRNEVRPRTDDAVLIVGSGCQRVVDRGRFAADMASVDFEVGHRVAAE